MTILSVNLNKVALIRNSRDTRNPCPIVFARMAIDAGAGGITVHPRPDQRHIRASDCAGISSAIDVEFNIEGNPFAPATASQRGGVSDYPGFMPLVESIRPAQVTLVPDGDEQLTSDHGFDLTQDAAKLEPIIRQLKDWGCRVSLFMDPIADQMAIASDIGADRIESHRTYARAFETGDFVQTLEGFQSAAAAATHRASVSMRVMISTWKTPRL